MSIRQDVSSPMPLSFDRCQFIIYTLFPDTYALKAIFHLEAIVQVSIFGEANTNQVLLCVLPLVAQLFALGL